MRPADNIERQINRLQVEPRSEVSKKNIEDALAAQKKVIESADLQPTIWRIIMKSKITKFAAAVAVVITAIIILHQLGGSIDPANVAFAKATEALKQVNWIHITEPDSEEWTNYNLQVRATKHKDGRIIFSDYQQGRQFEYNSEKNQVCIYPLNGSLDKADTPILWEEQSEVFRQKMPNRVISSAQSRFEGRNVGIYILSWTTNNGTKCSSEVTVDVETNLPVSALYKEIDPDGKVLVQSRGIFEYPQRGPVEIYDVGVPDNTRVLDYSSGNLEKAMEESRQKLRSLCLALIMYQDENQGKYPDILQDCRAYLSDNIQWYLENVEYIGKGLVQTAITNPARTPLAYDKTLLHENGQKTHIAFSDGHLEFCNFDAYVK
jgi:hypothetical protein